MDQGAAPIRHPAPDAVGVAGGHQRHARRALGMPDLAVAHALSYGQVPAGLELQPAVAFKARIARIVDLAVGEGVGYGQIWHAERPTRVALVTAGYADGIRRGMSNRGCALVHGTQAPVIGRVSMDQTTLDITHIPGAAVGDAATFFGEDGGASLPLASFAAAADTIPHEALTSICSRVARVYRRGGRVAKIVRLAGATEVLSHVSTATF